VPPAQSTVYVKEGESSLTCPGTPENPTAPSHTTCLYESFAYNVEFGRGYVLLGKTGVGLYARSNGPEDFYVEGTWAATG